MKSLKAVIAHLDIKPGNLNPQALPDYTASYAAAALYEPLLHTHTDGNISPGLVDKWSIDDTNRFLDLHVRTDTTFSDGSPLKAADFIRTIRSGMQSPSGTSKGLLSLLMGSNLNEESVTKLSDSSLRMKLREGGHRYLSVLSSPNFTPVPQHAEPWQATTGPYYAPFWIPGDHSIELLPNHSYTRKAHGPAPHLTFDVVSDRYESFRKWQAGEAHITGNTMFPHEYLENQDISPYLQSSMLPLMGVLRVNSSLRRRRGFCLQALAETVPRAKISESLNGYVEPLKSYWPGGTSSISSRENVKSSRPENRKLTVAVSNFFPNLEVCQKIADAWSQELNIALQIDTVDFYDLPKTEGTHDLTYVIMGPPYPNTASLLLQIPMLACGLNSQDLRRRETVVAGAGAPESNRTSESVGLTHSLNEIMPWIPVLQLKSVVAVAEELTGFTIDSFGRPNFSDLQFSC
ncbi:ABC transporter substrate-binding protein [Streptomyces atratus]|uniref:ABC transporter substrate-binding protein n=1 Tax=Streptomyces atratus TaxID=1893 RepID=UPI00379A7F9F